MRLLSPALRAQIVKEMLSILRDPRSRIVLVVPPLLQLLVFTFAVSLEVNNVVVAVHSQDTGVWSQRLIQQIAAAAFVSDVRRVDSEQELMAAIDRQDVIAAIDIQTDFSRRIARGEMAVAQVILDGRRANASQITFGYLNSIASGLGASLVLGSRAEWQPTVVRHWFNPNLKYRWFVVPSLAGILATVISLLVTALSIARERELGTFDQLLVSPATPIEIILAKIIPALVIGTALGLVMILLGIFLFGIPFRGSFALLMAALFLFILSVVGIGLVISAISATQQQAILGTFTVVVPMILMSGFATPVENMPDVLQVLAQAIPLKHFLIIVQGSFVKALPPSEVFANAWPMAVIAVVTLTAAVLFVRGRLE